MIDRDLAELYGVETRTINQAVKRNEERFPEEFRFQLISEEYDFLGLSQKYGAALIILNLQANANLLKFKYEQRRKR